MPPSEHRGMFPVPNSLLPNSRHEAMKELMRKSAPGTGPRLNWVRRILKALIHSKLAKEPTA